MPVSQQKLEANRRNAAKSTGPRTAAGKRRSSRNATKFGLFSRYVVLPGESNCQYRLMRQGLLLSWHPMNEMELILVERIAVATWKLRRLLAMERGMYADVERRQMIKTVDRLAQELDDPAQRDALWNSASQALDREQYDFGQPADPDPRDELDQTDEMDASPNPGMLRPLSQLEQRLENGMLRCIRELERVQKLRRQRNDDDDAEISPYLEDSGELLEDTQAEADATEAKRKNEATAKAAARAKRAAQRAQERAEAESRRQQCPQRWDDEDAKMKNEPTEPPAARPGEELEPDEPVAPD
jgi:hypothetical protein